MCMRSRLWQWCYLWVLIAIIELFNRVYPFNETQWKIQNPKSKFLLKNIASWKSNETNLLCKNCIFDCASYNRFDLLIQSKKMHSTQSQNTRWIIVYVNLSSVSLSSYHVGKINTRRIDDADFNDDQKSSILFNLFSNSEQKSFVYVKISQTKFMSKTSN